MAKLPSVSSDIPRDLRMFLDRVREAINGTGLDSVVTARQLAAAGIISYSGGTIVPPFGSQLVTAPVRPQNVEASGALANIIVTWDKPNYSGHAYAEIWAAAGTVETPPAIGDAILVGMAPGVSFPHNIGSGAQRWYWVRFVNANGEVGPYQSTDGVFGETSVDPAYMLEVLSGAITESQLYADLGARIDLVDGPVGLANSVAARLADEATARADEIALLAADVLDVTGMQSYDNATTYAQYDLVTSGGNIYRALQATTGNTPPNATYWELVGAYASLAGGIVANASAVSALTVRVQDTEDGIDTVASDITDLAVRVTDTESGVSANAGAVTALTTRVTTAEGSIASQAGQITALEVGLADLSGVAAYDNAATYAAGDYATYNDKLYRALQATTGNLPTNATYWELLGDFTSLGELAIANAGAIEALDARVEIAEGTITSQSSAITTLSGTVTNQGLGITANASAISGLTTRVSTAEGAITSQSESITNLSSDLADLTGTVGTTATALSNLTTRVTDAEGVNTAQASAITALVTTSGANTAAISAESTARATSDGELFAQYTVKVDVNGYVSGFGLASTAVDGVPTSDFLVRADSFAIASPSGPGITPSEPFVVRTTSTTINGEAVPAGVYIKDGFIQNGTITTAKIGDAAIDNAKIADATITNAKITTLDATKITSGFISADRIAAASLVAGKLAADSVSAANLQAGSVVASKIEAGAVETSKLRVGDFVNYVENASFLLGDTAWTTGTGGFSITTGNARSGVYALQRSITNGTTGNSYNDAQFSAVAGDKFVISAWVKQSADYAGGNIQIGIRWYNYAGVFISDNQTGIAATTTYQEISGTLTAPANAAYGRVRCRCVSQTAGTAYWDDISLLRKQKGDALIVEGTLSASAVSADFIDAFELNADNITAGTITADRLLH
jgi:uncharacterized coiled-coil protein SlyX